jgi:hypothetical protein
MMSIAFSRIHQRALQQRKRSDRKRTILICICRCLFLTSAFLATQETAQSRQEADLGKSLRILPPTIAKLFIEPIAIAYTINANSNWLHRAPRATMLGFDLEVGAVAMSTPHTEDQHAFSAATDYLLSGNQASDLVRFVDGDPALAWMSNLQKNQIKTELVVQMTIRRFQALAHGPTAIGSLRDSIVVRFPRQTYAVNSVPGISTVTVPDQDLQLPVGGMYEEMPAHVFAAPQLTIGTIAGSQLIIRYLPLMEMQDVGSIECFGWGVQHNPSVWLGELNPIPFDFSINFLSQTMKVGDIQTTRSTALGCMASKRFGKGLYGVTPYVSYLAENSSIDIHYTYDSPNPTIGQPPIPAAVSFGFENPQRSRLTLGLNARILILNLNAEYTLAAYRSYALGMAVAF